MKQMCLHLVCKHICFVVEYEGELVVLKNIVVWGLGGNGKNIIAVLKDFGIKAIVENNPEKVKLKEYEGIPLITPQDFFCRYTDNYLIVSMMDYEGVLKQLERHSFKKYFLYTEREYTFYICLLIKSKEIEKVLGLNKATSYCITHMDMVSVFLFEYLKTNGYDITICDNGEQIIDILLLDGIINKVDLITNISNKCLITPEEVNDVILERDRERIRKFKDIHKGESVFIVATGPSLKIEDLERIKKAGYSCISMNGIYEVFSDTEWRPDYYVASDALRIEQIEKQDVDILDNLKCFFSNNYIGCPKLRERKKSYFFSLRQDINNIKFSDDFSQEVCSGKTVAYACMQLAAYMGFKTIFLLGFDHWSSNSEVHFYDDEKEASYMKFYTYEKQIVEAAYECAHSYMKKNNILIYNVTRGGGLEVFQRKNLDDLLMEHDG